MPPPSPQRKPSRLEKSPKSGLGYGKVGGLERLPNFFAVAPDSGIVAIALALPNEVLLELF